MVKVIKKTISVFLVIVFIISSTGVVLFYNHCCCTGNETVSFYISHESCGINAHNQISEDCCANEITDSNLKSLECLAEKNDCGCTKPVARFFKLANEMTNEAVCFVNFQQVKDFIKYFYLTPGLILSASAQEEIPLITGPPPEILSSHDFLIRIHQLKIPELS